MHTTKNNTYKGWKISVTAEEKMCSNFSFDITDPHGKSQHISMGGDNEQRAFERAKEMIDLEREFNQEE